MNKEWRLRILAFVYVILSVWFMTHRTEKIQRMTGVTKECKEVIGLSRGDLLVAMEFDGIIGYKKAE